MPNLNHLNQSMPAKGVDLLGGYLSKAECAQSLNIAERTLDRWHELRTGPPRTRIGHRVYYAIPHVEAWLESQRENV